MNGFQIIGLVLTGFLAAAAVRRLLLERSVSAVFWTGIWAFASIAIAFPETTVVVARTLGISRGADVVFYFGILGMLMGFSYVLAQLRQHERQITLLVRRQAIEHPISRSEPDAAGLETPADRRGASAPANAGHSPDLEQPPPDGRAGPP